MKHPAFPHLANPTSATLISVFACVLGAWAQIATIPFTEEAVARGVNYPVDQVWDVVPFGEGLAFIDLDQDGDDDLVVLGRADGLLGVFENLGNGTFVDRSGQTGIPLLPRHSGISAADFDLDGDMDLFLTRWEAPNHLFRNMGGFQFSDVSVEAGIQGLATDTTTGSGWADLDGDTYLDLAVGTRNNVNYLFHNNGDGSFTDTAVAQGVAQTVDPAFQLSFFDFDKDLDPDLYISNDRGMLSCPVFHNYLFENQNGQLVDITDASQTHSCTDSMTVTLGDFTGNGFQDIYVTSQDLGNSLLMNQGDGTFADHTQVAAVGSFTTGWGAVFFDYDHDGFQELYVCNMFDPNRFYRHGGSWPCNDIGPALGIANPAESYAIATADIDQDGDLDLALSSRDEPIRIYINHSGNLGNWVQFHVAGQGSDAAAIGARIDITHGPKSQLREVIAGSNYKSQNSLRQHFGLGSSTSLDQLTVTWRNGEFRTLTNLPGNAIWTLFPNEKLGDANGDNLRDALDFQAMLTCRGQSFQPGCEVLDFDGDSALTVADVDAFLLRSDTDFLDCNSNSSHDWREIFLQPDLDLNHNLALDACECLADLDANGTVDQTDLHLGLPLWGSAKSMADLDFNNQTNVLDYVRICSSQGPCP